MVDTVTRRMARAITQSFSPKVDDSEEWLYFDFSSVLPPATSISDADVDIEVASGADATPGAMLDGSPTFKNLVYGGYNVLVCQRVIGGVAGNIYKITVTPTTPALAPLSAYLPVESP